MIQVERRRFHAGVIGVRPEPGRILRSFGGLDAGPFFLFIFRFLPALLIRSSFVRTYSVREDYTSYRKIV